MKNPIIIFTDGSSLGNPGPGGWGAIIAYKKNVEELGGGERHTTNNRMELTGAIRALERIEQEKGDVIVHTDSRYVIRGITEWIFEWEKRGWITKAKQPVENRDLWEKLLKVVMERHTKGNMTWKHVGGHVGIAGNERVDEIATSFARGDELELYHGPVSKYNHDLKNITAKNQQTTSRTKEKSRSRARAFSYVSLVDGIFRRHKTWDECEKHVKGVSSAKFKKAFSEEDEKAIRAAWGLPERGRSQSGA